MLISQSRANSRGPLIAVIKIEIENDQVDRIFLHQNDDDYKLAQQFQQKHRLNPLFIQHIYLKIKASRQSLQRESLSMKSPAPNYSQRSTNMFNQSNYTPTPIQTNPESTYRNANDSFPTPFDRINKYTPLRQQQKQIFRPIANETYYQASQSDQIYPFRNHNEDSGDNQKEKLAQKDNSTFQTFMQHAKTKNSQQLFQKYLRERRQNQSVETKRLIQKQNPTVSNPISFYQSKEANNKTQQVRPKSIEGKIYRPQNVNQSIQQNKQSINSHYSFNQDKPQRVKILKKDQLESLQSSKKSLSKVEKQKIAKQVTDRLYNEGNIKRNYLNKIKERAKQEKTEKEDKQLTHRPQINKVSELIAADRYRNMPIQDYLIDKAKKSEVKKEAERAIKAQKQLQNCSFKPQVNIISQKLVRDNSRSFLKDSHNKTLQDCSRKHTKSQMAFRPSLNKMSQQIVKSKGQGGFQQRLKTFLEQKNNKLSALTKQKKVKQKLDQKGQQLFRPRIYSKPTNRSPKGSQVHDYLYEMSKIDKSKPIYDQRPKINENSQQIIQQMYIKRLAWLFSELDSDQDGFISPKRICIDSINQQILEVIIPVLFEMEEMDIELNLMDFRNAIKNLHPSLNAHQKSILYSYNNKH